MLLYMCNVTLYENSFTFIYGCFTYTFPAKSLIRSEFQYFAIIQKSEKNQLY